MTTYHLLTEPWLPVLRRDGVETHIAPWQLITDPADNPVVALNAPRPVMILSGATRSGKTG